jgi:MYXO-CTERM domain-containing protein
MVKQVPTPGTGLYGESFVYNADGTYTDVTSIPHLWEATLTYLALVAAYSPEAFTKPELATLDVPVSPDVVMHPPGCAVAPRAPSVPAALAPLALVAVLALRRRARRA